MQQADFIRAATLVFAAQADKRLSHLDTRILGLLLRTDGPPLKRAHVASICGCHSNSVSRAAKKLADLGYLIRETRRDEGNAPTRYAIPDVTSPCNPEVTTNREVTSLVAGALRPSPQVVTEDHGTTSSRNPEVTTLVTSPPLNPLNNTLPVGDNPSTPSLVLTGGPGEREPKPSRKKAKFVSTNDTLPAAMSPIMRRDADKAGFLNGTGEAHFDDWRDYHLVHASEMADCDASFRRWLRNATKYAKADAAKITGNIIVTPEGKQIKNVYRRA